ncbi:MAG: hypothetical protein RR949_04665 [Oscillospiraceae bacterium]
MRKEFLLPGGAVALGVGGFFLRHWELRTAFEPDTGLSVSGMPATISLMCLSILVAVAAIFIAYTYRKTEFQADYDKNFYAPHVLYFSAMVLAAVLILGAGLLGMWQYFSHMYTELVRFVFSILCLMMAASYFIMGGNNYKGRRQGKYSLYLLIPAFGACLWLLVSYLMQSGNPVILGYVYGTLAVVSALLSAYFVTGFAFGYCKPLCAIAFSLMGIYFGIVALAGADLFSALLHGSAVLYQLSNVTTLLYRTQHPTQFVTEVISDEG